MNDTTDQQQTAPHQPIKEPPVLSKHFHLPRVIMILIVAIISAVVFGMIGYISGLTTQQKVTREPSVTITPKSSPQSSAQPTIPTDTKNWKTYTSPNGDFTFQYPSHWTASYPASTDPYSTVSVGCNIIAGEDNCKSGESIYRLIGIKFRTATEASSIQKNLSEWPNASVTNTTLDGHPAVAIVAFDAPNKGSTSVEYIVNNKGVTYDIGISFHGVIKKKTSLNELLPLTPDIISTFKFTK